MKSNPKITYGIIALACAALFAMWFLTRQNDDYFVLVNADSTVPPSASTVFAAAETEPAVIYVYIVGAVENPGVYALSEGARLDELLALAGGATPEADLVAVNLSMKLRDEQQIIIPKIGEEVDKSLSAPQNSNSGLNAQGLVNINTADAATLQTLPGVGKTIADAIIEYRNTNGGFKSIDELKKVYRIGDKTFEGLKDSVAIE